MKCLNTGFVLKSALFPLLLTFPLIYGTPSRYNMFQGSAYSGSEQRQRNKNWCAYVVHKNVSYAVVGGTESFVQPESAPCQMHQPNCAQQVMYRTQFRPMYKVGYKLVTELEWRCCPGYQGHDCKDLKGVPSRQTVLGPRSNPSPAPGHIAETQGRGQQAWGQSGHPWGAERQPGGQTGQGGASGQVASQGGSQTTQQMEEEVQRLSQQVLDMQAAMTSLSANLRVDLQEDASKMLVTLLNNLRQPESVRGEQQSMLLQDLSLEKEYKTVDMDEFTNKINNLADTLNTKSNTLDDLQARVNHHDGQLRLLMEATQAPLATPPSAPPANDAALRAYVDAKFHALRDEMMEGMEIKMSDLKNSCDYKILSVQEQSEFQENSYLSLTELLESKEMDLRKEIQDLKNELPGLLRGEGTPPGLQELQKELFRVSEAQLKLQSSLEKKPEPDPLLPHVEELEARLNMSERSVEVHSLFLEEKLRREWAEGATNLKKAIEDRMSSMEDRVTSLLVEISSPLSRPRSGLEALQGEVTSHKTSVQALEDRFNAHDQLCSTECKSDQLAIESIQDNLQVYKTSLDTMQSNMKGHSASLGDMEEFVQGQLLNHTASLTDTQEELWALKGRMGGQESFLSALGLSLSQQSLELQGQLLNHSASLAGVEEALQALSGRIGVQEGSLSDLGVSLSAHLKDVRGELGALSERIGGQEGSLSALGVSLSRQSLELQQLNTCCQSSVGPVQDARDLLELHLAQREELRARLEELGQEVRAEAVHCRNRTEGVALDVTTVDGRVASLDNMCGRLEPISSSLHRIKEGLNKHVTGLWNCVSEINDTLLAHTKDIEGLKGTYQNLQDHFSVFTQDLHHLTTSPENNGVHGGVEESGNPTKTKPVSQGPVLPIGPIPDGALPPHMIETGEAGAPGIMISSKPPKGADGSMTPIKGFAGAPASPPSKGSLKPNMPVISVAHIPLRPSLQKPYLTLTGERVSFSAGLNLLPFPGEVGIIRFNKVLVNDGGHYDPHTGIFNVPMEGHYLLSAVLTAQRGARVEAVLSVSNHSIQRLDTAGYLPANGGGGGASSTSCDCGGSASLSLVLTLKRGDRAGLVMTAGKLAISENTEVLSTFSAVLLYPTSSKR
ncbi:EMILIN-2 [Salvelinus sp. IW2-2015]|uniref:EMILIN-2 n=1 Tax=Salvelinus sp. IW2-2015 TaxID=2691554 RepID=UPI000CDFB7F1|nr:EMILIN-2 [Salvelinus alpinus]